MDERVPVIEKNEKEIVTQAPQKSGIVNYLGKIIKEIIAAGFWLYVLMKLFIFDVDTFLFNKLLPEYAWLLNLKFFILLTPA